MKRLSLFLILFFLFSCKQRFYRASSHSMEETIMAGEAFYTEPSNKFEKNDIVVFNYFGPDYGTPAEEPGKYNMHWEKRIYRLIAYSDDTVEIKNGEVFVNLRHIPLPPKAKMKYKVLSKVYIDEFSEIYPYANPPTKNGDTLEYIVDLTTEKAFDFEQKKPAIISVKKTPPLPADDTLYAKTSLSGNWSSNNYGPIRIPGPGETIFIDSVNFKLYHNIPGIKTGRYLLQEKLYFVLGDNRYGAEDSRFIGLIPQSKMYGIVK